jgi:hypothetical protein
VVALAVVDAEFAQALEDRLAGHVFGGSACIARSA